MRDALNDVGVISYNAVIQQGAKKPTDNPMSPLIISNWYILLQRIVNKQTETVSKLDILNANFLPYLSVICPDISDPNKKPIYKIFNFLFIYKNKTSL